MTIKELQEQYPRNESEVYKMKSTARYWRDVHTDNIEFTDEYDENAEVFYYELMDQEKYGSTIEANGYSTTADWWGDDILVVIIE